MERRALPRRRFAGLLTAALVALAYVAVAEIVLRFLPVTTGLRSVAVDNAQPIFHFEANRDFVYSRDWNLREVVRGRVNNDGWVNRLDYEHNSRVPLIAVIGDSYIEAQMVPYAETMQGRLAVALQGKARVYSFAAAGAPLSEFAVYAAYAVDKFGARAVVLNVADYGFADSDDAYRRSSGMWVYAGAGADKQLRLVPYHPGWVREVVRDSALLRYLLLNLHLDRAVAALRAAQPGSVRPAAAAAPENARLDAAKAVIPLFFRDFQRLVGLPRDRVLFVLNGMPFGTKPDPEKQELRRLFAAAVGAQGYEAVDLDPLFAERYRRDGPVFQIAGDRHWNGEGHAIAASAAMASRLIADLLAQPR